MLEAKNDPTEDNVILLKDAVNRLDLISFVLLSISGAALSTGYIDIAVMKNFQSEGL